MKRESGQQCQNSRSQNQFHKKRLELLAPAGSFETLKAVIHAGADAVYLGGSRFGARAYAENLTHEELLAAIDYAHLQNRKVYLTVNTLLKQPEMEALYAYLLPYYEHGLDAVIVQDFGVLQLVHACFPELSIHASTQMSIAGAYGAAYLKKFGVKRIVTARELSLKEIEEIQPDIEIESFVHGALCYSYSGQCLFSSLLGGRSGNRGRCAQPCRLPYTVLDKNKRMMAKPECYPLSPKDLCVIGQIPALAKAGVDSFKIEGRMKSAEYAAGVTAVYRGIIDQYLDTGRILVQKHHYQQLLDTGNRSGFTDGYYKRHNGQDMITMARPGHTKDDGGFLNFVHEQYVKKEQKIPVRAEAFFKTGEPAALTLSYGEITASVQHGMAEAAKKQPMSRGMIMEQLSKTGNTPFAIESMTVTMDEPVFLPKQMLNQLRRKAIGNLEEQMLSPHRRTAGEAAEIRKTAVNAANTANTINAANNRTYFYAAVEEEAQLDAVLQYAFITRIYLDSTLYQRENFAAKLAEHVRRIQDRGRQAYLVLPSVFRMETARFYQKQWQAVAWTGIDGFLAKNYDELGFLSAQQVSKARCVLDHSLYTYSDYTKSCFQNAGWKYDTIPLELNKKELLARSNAASELIIYGRMPLMTSAQCLHKTLGQCRKTPALCYLKDRYAKEFPVKNNCSECYNTIYNAQPLSLIQAASELADLRTAAYRLHFTIESETQACRVLDCLEQSFFEHVKPDMRAVIGAYTNGHYKRGVE